MANIKSDVHKADANLKIAIKTGADNYAYYLTLLENKKIEIVTNQTGFLSNKLHLVDFLLDKNVTIQKNIRTITQFSRN